MVIQGGMHGRSLMLVAAMAYCVAAPSDHGVTVPNDPPGDVVYSCPMDPDVRSYNPGTCRRCGMELVPGAPEPVEFHTDVTTIPSALLPGRPAVLQFAVHDPWKDQP